MKDCSSVATQAESFDSDSIKTVIPQNSSTNIQNLPIPNNNCTHPCTSINSSHCIVSNLQDVLNTLQDCLPGDCGVYIDGSSYKDVLNVIERILVSCGKAYPSRDELSRLKIIGMNKCSTQPTLKTTYEEVPKRMISSSTDCNKIYKKKMRA